MGFLSPTTRKPRSFDYKPRFYDPEKEAREERRKELCGADTEEPGEQKYVPGQFIRQGMLSRRGVGRKKQKGGSNRTRTMIAVLLALGLVFLLKFIVK